MKTFRKYSQRSVLSLTVAALVSGAFQPFPNSHVIAATITQSNRRDEETRPRRVAEPKKPAANADGPMIRIGLLVDATSVSVSSPSGIIARRVEEASESDSDIVSQVRVEVRRGVVAPVDSLYRVEVAKVSEARAARKLTDELKKKFDEPVTSEQNEEKDEYRILIGRFKSRREADAMAERLRDEKYKSARVTLDSQVVEKRPAVGSRYQQRAVIDRASADETELRYRDGIDKSDIRSVSRENSIVALNANKTIASSEDSIILAPVQPAIESFGKRNEETIPAKKSIDRPPALKVNGKDYRGEIQLMINRRGRINVVNSLPLEQYLRGVVPLELSPGSFPQLEALKAQAVAARSYALSHFGRYNLEGFDLSDDTRSQVYGGLSAEHPLTNRAVEETRGMVAVYTDTQGRAVPIQALYTSTCGGQTEDNESVFLTEPVAYLRSVTCAPDAHAKDHEIKSTRAVEPLAGADGRSAARDIALMDVLGFKLPSRVTAQYLRSSADQDEVIRWAERATVLARRSSLRVPRGDVTRLAVFASLIASAFYGEGRESLLFSPADTDYILAGVVADDVPRDTRADLAMLLKDGILRLPADSRIGAKSSLNRAFAIETIARALYLKSQISNLKSQTVQSVDNNRLVINNTQSGKGSSSRSSSQSATTIEIEKGAWLFRRIGGESYAVDRLTLVGGERVSYHLNGAGRIDFLEAEMSERGAASDRFSNVGRWKERVAADELKRRLSRSRVAVGDIEDLVATVRGKSNRVKELEIIGSQGRSSLTGSRVRSALGLRETLFVVEPERDERGRIAAFIFTGRGWGHGVGMCQTGAYGLAKEGYSYRAIIQKYYTGVRLQKGY